MRDFDSASFVGWLNHRAVRDWLDHRAGPVGWLDHGVAPAGSITGWGAAGYWPSIGDTRT